MSQRKETCTFHRKESEIVASESEPLQGNPGTQYSLIKSGRSPFDTTNHLSEGSKKRPRENDPLLNLRGEEEDHIHREYRRPRLMPATTASPQCNKISSVSCPATYSGPFQLSSGTCSSTDESVARLLGDANYAHGLYRLNTPDVGNQAGLGKKFLQIMPGHGEKRLPSKEDNELLNMAQQPTAIFLPHSQTLTGIQTERPSQSVTNYSGRASNILQPSEDRALVDLMKSRPSLRISGTSCMAEEPFINEQNIYGDSKPEGQYLETAAAFPNRQKVVGAGEMQASSQIMNRHLQQQSQLLSQTKLNSDIFSRLLASPASSSSHSSQVADQFHVNMDPHLQKPNTSADAVQMRFMSNSDHSRRPHQYTSFNNEISMADLSYRDPGRFQRSSSTQERPLPSRQLTHSGVSFPPTDFRDSMGIATLQGTLPTSAYSMFLNVAESQSYIGRQIGLSGFQPATTSQQEFVGKAPCKAMIPREVSESIGALLQKPFESAAAPSVTVVKEGRAIGRGVCLQDYDSYEGLARALRDMFGSEATLDSSSCESPYGLESAVPGYKVAYEDNEGDLLLAGDLSWKDFVRAAKRIRLLPTNNNKPNVIGTLSL